MWLYENHILATRKLPKFIGQFEVNIF